MKIAKGTILTTVLLTLIVAAFSCPVLSADLRAGAAGVQQAGSPPPVPTLSEWGMIIFALMLLSLASAMVIRRFPVAAHVTTGSTTVSGNSGPALFNAGLYGGILAILAVLALGGTLGAVALYGTISAVDISGTIASCLVAAYLVQLWVLQFRLAKY